jgi:hypothetical protein
VQNAPAPVNEGSSRSAHDVDDVQRIGGLAIAAPCYMAVRSHEHEAFLIGFRRRSVADVDHLQWRAALRRGFDKS